MVNLIGFSLLNMDSVAYRGMLYTFFILNFVLVCQLILLQPLVSASGAPTICFVVSLPPPHCNLIFLFTFSPIKFHDFNDAIELCFVDRFWVFIYGDAVRNFFMRRAKFCAFSGGIVAAV